VVTRPGYPWDRPNRDGLPEGASTLYEGVEYLHLRTPSLFLPLDTYFREAGKALAKVARSNQVAAIHAASNHVNAFPALLAARQLGLPFAYEMRGLWDMSRAAKIAEYENSDRYRLGMQLEALVAKEADRVFVISQALGEYLTKEWGIDPAKVELLPNCVNPETIERAKKMAGPKPDVFTVGYAGSLLEYEGLDLLVDALAELKKRGTIVHARIIGEGPERKKLEQRAKEAGLNGNIRFLGCLAPDEARARLAETHAVVLPRRSSAVSRIIPPLKLVEAQALDLPVIAPDLEIFSRGEPPARLFSHDSSSSLAKSISSWLKASDQTSANGNNAPSQVATWSSKATGLIEWVTGGKSSQNVDRDGTDSISTEEAIFSYESGGLPEVQRMLDAAQLAPAARERTLLALAKHYQQQEQPGTAAALGRAAYDINPQPALAKWLAFRLFDAGQITEPLALLEGPAAAAPLSDSEARRAVEIKVLAAMSAQLPEVPGRASAPPYQPLDGALLYVAASCLPYHTSGYTARTHELNLALQKAGNATLVTRPGYPWDRPKRDALPEGNSTLYEGVEYLHLRTPSLFLPLDTYFREAGKALAKVAKKQKVAAIHAASNHVNALPALLAARQLGLPFAYEMRGLWDMSRAAKVAEYENSERYRLGMQLEALVAKEADRVFVISKALGEYITKEWGIDPAKIELLPNCVNPETMERAKKMVGPKPDIFTVGYAGSLLEYEGLDLLIDALAELKKGGTIVHARIIGDGPERKKLEQRSKEAGLNGNIQFLGGLTPDEARARLAETHAAVLPRRSSAVCRLVPPLKLVEAQALNLPVIAPDLEVFASEIHSATLFCHDSALSLAERIFSQLKSADAMSAGIGNAPSRAAAWSSTAPSLREWVPRRTPSSDGNSPCTVTGDDFALRKLAELAKRKHRFSLGDVEEILVKLHVDPSKVETLRLLHRNFKDSEPRLSALLGWLCWRACPNAELAATVRSQLIKLGEMKLPLQLLKEVDVRNGTPPELAISRRLQNDINLWSRGFPLPPKAASPPYDTQPTVLYLLHNSLPYNSGGYATRTHGLLQAINQAGRFSIIGVTRPGYPSDHKAHISKPLPANIPTFDEIDGVRYERCEQSWRRSSATLAEYVDAFAWRVENLARKHRCCLIHAASNFPNGLAAALAARRLGIPAIYEVRGLWELTRMSRDPLWHRSEHYAFTASMETQACAAADAVITLTGGLRDLLVERGTPADKISILPNSVNPELFVPAERNQELAQSLGIHPDDVIVGYLGSIVAYEGLDDLLRALSLLRAKGIENIKFLLVGDGAALPSLQRLVAELGLQDIAIIAGRVPHESVADYYSLVDIAAFPRKPLAVCETVSPIKPLEAMCMAKAIVVSSVKALAEMVRHGETGLIFKSGDANDLARSLSVLIDNPTRRQNLGLAARDWATETRTWDTACHTAEDLYEQLLVSVRNAISSHGFIPFQADRAVAAL
jgi:glycosyltransferase involved in cell wall biosynthesis